MPKQKLLFVITKGNWGGAQRYVYDLATNLPKRLFEITVAAGAGSLLPARLATGGIRTISLHRLGRDVRINNDLKTFFALIRLFRDEKSDIIHLNSSKVGGLGAFAGQTSNWLLVIGNWFKKVQNLIDHNQLPVTSYKLQATRIIFTAHGWAFNEKRPWFARVAIALLHWLTILLAHRTIVVAAATRRQMSRFPFANRRMVVVKNGLSKISFLDRPTARITLLGKEANDQDQSWWLGTISELHPNKGLEYLIRAVKILLDNDRQGLALTVVIIGAGEERANLERLIKELKLEKQIFLLGRRENASQYLKAFDVFTLTSITEAFPYTILEAGAAGLPVIASGVGGIPEIVKSMDSGILVKPGEPSEIAAALEFLFTHPAKTAQFGRVLRRRVAKEFSTTRMVKETMAVYNEANAPKS